MTDVETPVAWIYPPQRLGIAEMCIWFHKLAEHLDAQLDGPPTGFLVVLLNDEQLRVWSAGPMQMQEDAAQAAKDASNHRRWPLMYEAPDVMRARRREWRRAQEAETPWVCEVCQARMETRRDYDRHQAPGHHCLTCGEVYLTVEAWEAHPCVAQPSGPVQLRVVPHPRDKEEPA